MRLCRFQHNGHPTAGFYDEQGIIAVGHVADQFARTAGRRLSIPDGDNLLPFLPRGEAHQDAKSLSNWLDQQAAITRIPLDQLELLVPIPRPNKLFLLAGNYAEHIEEGGGVAAERAETFPYVFMKPPTTTLTDPGSPIVIPAISPEHIDWELELGVIIAETCKAVAEADALDYVAGYTVVNDISNRKFRPNPGRRTREKDAFFDWLHGKWHDSFCPCGPCVTSAHSIADPQKLDLRLSVNGKLKQNSSTANQIFPVAAVIEFISSFVTLEPGDVISTGTPAGVGAATATFLQPGDRIEARISQIGTLCSRVVAEG
jgi:2-keto-4-pentenoate hydratase/2-oxohepta-3-ene-1,7-dioic acid hydratase in catechol pathway